MAMRKSHQHHVSQENKVAAKTSLRYKFFNYLFLPLLKLTLRSRFSATSTSYKPLCATLTTTDHKLMEQYKLITNFKLTEYDRKVQL